MHIGDIQIWTELPTGETFGGTFILEGKVYIVTQRELDRIRSLPNAEEIVERADRIYTMIRDGKIKLRDAK